MSCLKKSSDFASICGSFAIAGATLLCVPPDLGEAKGLFVVAKSGAWTVLCEPRILDSQDCAVVQNVKSKDHNVSVKASLSFVDYRDLFFTLRTNPIFGDKKRVVFSIDGDDAGFVDAAACDPKGCDAEVKLDDEFIHLLLNGQRLAITTRQSIDSGAAISLDLTGIGGALLAMHDRTAKKDNAIAKNDDEDKRRLDKPDIGRQLFAVKLIERPDTFNWTTDPFIPYSYAPIGEHVWQGMTQGEFTDPCLGSIRPDFVSIDPTVFASLSLVVDNNFNIQWNENEKKIADLVSTSNSCHRSLKLLVTGASETPKDALSALKEYKIKTILEGQGFISSIATGDIGGPANK